MSVRFRVTLLMALAVFGIAANESHARGPRRRRPAPVRSYPRRPSYRPAPVHRPPPTMRDLMPRFSPGNGYRLPSMIGIPQVPTRPPLPFHIEAKTNKQGSINGGRLIFDEGAKRLELEATKEGEVSGKLRVPIRGLFDK